MSDRAAIGEIVGAYENYALLAGALGFRVQKSAVRRHALNGMGYRGEMKSFFSSSYAERHAERTAPKGVFAAVDGLVHDLAATMKAALNGQAKKVNGSIPKLCDAVKGLEVEKRRTLCEEIERGAHASYLRRQELPIAEFHKALQAYAASQTVARGKLIEHIQQELQTRGIRMSRASIEERFRRNTKVRTVPACLLEIVTGLGDQFRTGLVGIETLVGEQPPEEWVEACREELGFRSKNSMHRAIAEATAVNYETVHKALTRPRAGQRIQKQIVDALLAWRGMVRRGERLPVAAQYLGSSSRPEVTGLLRRLSRQAPSPKQACRDGARALGVAPGAALQAMAGHEGDDFAPRGVRTLKELVKRREARHSSFLIGPARRAAAVLAQRAETARERWHAHPDDTQFERLFKKRRLQLIMAIREGVSAFAPAPEPAFDVDDEDESVE